MLYNPWVMRAYTIVQHMGHEGIYRCTIHDPWRTNFSWVMCCTIVFYPHGSCVVQRVVRRCTPHGSWEFVTIVSLMTHEEKVAETCAQR